MAIRAQEILPDRVFIEADDGSSIEYTSADALKAGGPDAAREAFYGLVREQLSEHVADGCLYLEVADDFSFAALETANVSPDTPPPTLRSMTTDKNGDIQVIAFSGAKGTISAVDLKAAPDAAIAIAEALIDIAGVADTKSYQVAVTKDGNGDVATIDVSGIAVVIAQDVVAEVTP